MELKNIFVDEIITLRDALKKLNKVDVRILLVTDKAGALKGTLTDGDIRRYILEGGIIDDNLVKVYNPKPISMKQIGFNIEKAKKILIENNIELLPIVNNKNIVVDYVNWIKAFGGKPSIEVKPIKIDAPVIIMAGGKGTRLKPFTKVFPKPLIPIGEKTVIEYILDKFERKGFQKFYISLNYKGSMIESYFHSIEKNYDISFIREDQFSGTAGSLKLIKDTLPETFVVSNCDIIADVSYGEVINFHEENNASLTILSALQTHSLPYGVVSFENGGIVTEIKEKPEYNVPINTGIYVFSKTALDFMPESDFVNMNDFITRLLNKNQKVLTFPIDEHRFVDIGQWEEYKKAKDMLKTLIVS